MKSFLIARTYVNKWHVFANIIKLNENDISIYPMVVENAIAK